MDRVIRTVTESLIRVSIPVLPVLLEVVGKGVSKADQQRDCDRSERSSIILKRTKLTVLSIRSSLMSYPEEQDELLNLED